MRSVLIVIFVFFYLLLGLPVLGAMWIIHKFAPAWADMAQLRLVQWAFRVIIFLSGADIEFIGEENVPKDEAVLYIGNHRSFFDIIITYSRCPRLTGYISKQSITKIPVLGLWMKRLHCLFLDRDDIKQGLKVVLAAIDQVKSGISICVFPEGTRCKNKDDLTDVQSFKEGTFKIATKTGCPIVPISMNKCQWQSWEQMKYSKITFHGSKRGMWLSAMALLLIRQHSAKRNKSISELIAEK